jgi:hypothetical protein
VDVAAAAAGGAAPPPAARRYVRRARMYSVAQASGVWLAGVLLPLAVRVIICHQCSSERTDDDDGSSEWATATKA